MEYQVSEATIETWYEKVIKDPAGERFFLKRGSALAPSNKANDFPTILRMLLEHQKAIKEKRALEDPTLPSSSASLLRLYKACWMNRPAGDLAKIAKLGTLEMVNWTKKDARVVIVYCFVNRKEKGKPDFSIMEQVLRTLHAMEYKDDNQFRRVRYPGVFITDRAGMVEVANAVLERGSAITQSLPWLHTPTLYITQGIEGFLQPQSPEPTMPLYFNFVYGNDFNSTEVVNFRAAFGNEMPFQIVMSAAAFEDAPRQWAQNGYANFNIDAVNKLLGMLGAPNNVLVNVGGGPSITWVGLVRLS